MFLNFVLEAFTGDPSDEVNPTSMPLAREKGTIRGVTRFSWSGEEGNWKSSPIEWTLPGGEHAVFAHFFVVDSSSGSAHRTRLTGGVPVRLGPIRAERGKLLDVELHWPGIPSSFVVLHIMPPWTSDDFKLVVREPSQNESPVESND
jgi:hypothetical protein